MWQYNNTDELYHYGVLGMRWGHRNNRQVVDSHRQYKQATKAERKLGRKYRWSKAHWLAGVDNAKTDAKNKAAYQKAIKKREESAFKLIDSAAKDAYNKKLAKTGSKEKAEKASLKVHWKAFRQGKYGAGRVGSIADASGNYGQTKYYKHLVKTKGKKYASKVEKKMNRRTAAALAGTAAAYVGLKAVEAYYNRKH